MAVNISTNQSGLILGEIRLYSGLTAPNKWHLCDGSSLLIADYPDLAALFYDGTEYIFGSVDSTHFNLPDLKGRFPLGAGSNSAEGASTANYADTATTAGTINKSVGDHGGELKHKITTAELAKHHHGMGIRTTGAGGEKSGTGIPPHNNVAYGSAWQSGDIGSDTPHNNMPLFTVINYIIYLGK